MASVIGLALAASGACACHGDAGSAGAGRRRSHPAMDRSLIEAVNWPGARVSRFEADAHGFRTVLKFPDGVTDPFVTQEPAPHAGPILVRHYEIVRALQTSNAGGAYQARDTCTGHAVFIKEARAHNGYTWDGVSAEDRLRREYEVLRWVGSNAPIARTEPSGHDAVRYFAACRRILRSLEDVLTQLLARGHRFRDLSPGNVLVPPEGDARLVDFEAATPLSGPPAAMAPTDSAAAGRTHRHRSGSAPAGSVRNCRARPVAPRPLPSEAPQSAVPPDSPSCGAT